MYKIVRVAWKKARHPIQWTGEVLPWSMLPVSVPVPVIQSQKSDERQYSLFMDVFEWQRSLYLYSYMRQACFAWRLWRARWLYDNVMLRILSGYNNYHSRSVLVMWLKFCGDNEWCVMWLEWAQSIKHFTTLSKPKWPLQPQVFFLDPGAPLHHNMPSASAHTCICFKPTAWENQEKTPHHFVMGLLVVLVGRDRVIRHSKMK